MRKDNSQDFFSFYKKTENLVNHVSRKDCRFQMDTKRHESKYITFVTIFCESANVNLVKRKKYRSFRPVLLDVYHIYFTYIYFPRSLRSLMKYTKGSDRFGFLLSDFFFNPSLAKEMRFKKKRKRRKSSCRLVVISSTTNEKSIAEQESRLTLRQRVKWICIDTRCVTVQRPSQLVRMLAKGNFKEKEKKYFFSLSFDFLFRSSNLHKRNPYRKMAY